jgi:hypothetical protein
MTTVVTMAVVTVAKGGGGDSGEGDDSGQGGDS